MDKKALVKVGLALVLGLIVYLSDFGLPTQAHSVIVVTVVACVLWITEVIPLHVTSLIVAFLLATLVKIPEKDVFYPFFDPVIALLLGGFVLAIALQKYGLDMKIAYSVIKRTGSTPGMFMLGIMSLTAFISLWVSNTATTAAILPIAVAALVASKVKKGDNYAKALVLGVACAATIGGMGTLIGSTPNVIVASFLAKEGITINFVSWLYYAFPFTVVMLPISWFVLRKLFKSEVSDLEIKNDSRNHDSYSQKLVMIIFLITVILWATDRIHGISNSVVALVPIFLLYIFRLLTVEDFYKVDWASLILFGGGLSLGSAIHSTGLDMVLAEVLSSAFSGLPIFVIFFCVAAFGTVLTAFISNTVAASLLIPIMLPLSKSLGLDVTSLGMLAALGVSLDFILPIGTPPGMMAYSTGHIKMWDMIKSGLIISFIGLLILAVFAYTYW